MQRSFSIAAAVVVLAMAGRSDAQQILYNNMNVANFTGFGWYEDPGSTNTSFNPITNNRQTIFIADDITLSPNLGNTIGRFQFTIFSDNVVNVTFRPKILFYNNNGLNNGPGTFLKS